MFHCLTPWIVEAKQLMALVESIAKQILHAGGQLALVFFGKSGGI
jgi:hypothetical protein